MKVLSHAIAVLDKSLPGCTGGTKAEFLLGLAFQPSLIGEKKKKGYAA